MHFPRLLAILLLALLGSTSLAASEPKANENEDVYAVIERGRQALIADKYVEAGKAFDQALKMPDFAEVEQSNQYRVFLFAAGAAQGREDYLSAHEFMIVATEFPQADDQAWGMRSLYAAWIEAWPDAGISLTTLAKRWPKALAKVSSELMQQVGYQLGKDQRHRAEQLDLFNALFAAHYKLDWDTEPAAFWKELITDAMARNDLRRAREIIGHVTAPTILVSMRIDHRFDELVKAEPKAFDIRAAADRECKRLQKVTDENLRSLEVRVQYGYALYAVGKFDEMVRLSDKVFAAVASAKADAPPFDDMSSHFNWIYDNKFLALKALGRWDDARAVLESYRDRAKDGSDKASQAINLGFFYDELDRPQDALKAIDEVDWAHSLSPYGRMQLEHVRYRAYLQQANEDEAEKVMAYLREHKEDAEDTWQIAMLDSGDVDGAAALFISRLRDADKRDQALMSAQSPRLAKQSPRAEAEQKRWEAMLARADVTAAINEFGRREALPIYDPTR